MSTTLATARHGRTRWLAGGVTAGVLAPCSRAPPLPRPRRRARRPSRHRTTPWPSRAPGR